MHSCERPKKRTTAIKQKEILVEIECPHHVRWNVCSTIIKSVSWVKRKENPSRRNFVFVDDMPGGLPMKYNFYWYVMKLYLNRCKYNIIGSSSNLFVYRNELCKVFFTKTAELIRRIIRNTKAWNRWYKVKCSIKIAPNWPFKSLFFTISSTSNSLS